MGDEDIGDIPRLQIEKINGFDGCVPGGLLVHPNMTHMVYSIGSSIIIEDLSTHNKELLEGHTNNISCMAMSKSGKYLASGQVTHHGYNAEIIIWDFENRCIHMKEQLHKVKVEAIAISPNDKYAVSLGGQDDGSVVVWDIETKSSVCGSNATPSAAGNALCLAYSNLDDNVFITGGEYTLRIWTLNRSNRKIIPVEIQFNQCKRIVKCLKATLDDSFVYCGTTTGDILKVDLKNMVFKGCAPENKNKKFSLGITAIDIGKTGDVSIGTGAGLVCKLAFPSLKIVKTTKFELDVGMITTIVPRGPGHQFFVGTSKSHILKFNLSAWTYESIATAHYSGVNDIIFPADCSDLFATCSFEEIRIWSSQSWKEILRIAVANMTCNAINFSRNGKMLLSAWDDGKIRGFYPESGSTMFVIHDAHSKGVSAISSTSDNSKCVSGGGEGQVRVWDIRQECRPQNGKSKSGMMVKMVAAMKEHNGAVTDIKIRRNDKECISTSTDGTCIIWNLERFVRSKMLMANTLFQCVSYRPDECQVITSGSDRKVAYWETYDGSQIRELEASRSGNVNGMDISADGGHFVMGGADRLVKLWQYNEGNVVAVGCGHSGEITRLKIDPNMKFIISISNDGAIIKWKYPKGC